MSPFAPISVPAMGSASQAGVLVSRGGTDMTVHDARRELPTRLVGLASWQDVHFHQLAVLGMASFWLLFYEANGACNYFLIETNGNSASMLIVPLKVCCPRQNEGPLIAGLLELQV
jgi:hypothetical protein